MNFLMKLLMKLFMKMNFLMNFFDENDLLHIAGDVKPTCSNPQCLAELNPDDILCPQCLTPVAVEKEGKFILGPSHILFLLQ